MAQENCDVCGKKLTSFFVPVSLKDGIMCKRCVKQVGLDHLGLDKLRGVIKQELSVEDIKDDLENHAKVDYKKLKVDGKDFRNKENEAERAQLEAFKQDNSINYKRFYFDPIKKQLLLKKSLLYPQEVFNYADILSYSKIIHGNEVKKHHGLLRAAAGGALFGGAGAIVGAVTGGKNYETVNKMAIDIHLKDGTDRTIAFISTEEKTSSMIYRQDEKDFDKICSVLDSIISQNNQKQVVATASVSTLAAPSNTANELRQLKGLVDDGIITQEDFEAKKKQLLGL